MQANVDIFGIWPSVDELAIILGEKPDTVYRWRLRRRIPQDAWMGIINAAATKGHALTVEELLAFNRPTKRRAEQVPARRRRAEARAG